MSAYQGGSRNYLHTKQKKKCQYQLPRRSANWLSEYWKKRELVKSRREPSKAARGTSKSIEPPISHWCAQGAAGSSAEHGNQNCTEPRRAHEALRMRQEARCRHLLRTPAPLFVKRPRRLGSTGWKGSSLTSPLSSLLCCKSMASRA